MRLSRVKGPRHSSRVGNGRLVALYIFILICIVLLVAATTVLTTLRTQEQTTVPEVLGEKTIPALLQVQERDLIPRIRLAYHDDETLKDTVIKQSPGPGANVRSGKEIELTISRGRAVFNLDSFIGQSIEEANRSIEKIESQHGASIQIGNVMYVLNDSPAGTILEQSPLPDSEVGVFTQLDLVVSLGAEQTQNAIVVPDLRNVYFENAIESLLRAGIEFRFSINNDTPNEDSAYLVTEQSSAPGSILNSNQLVLTINPPPLVDSGFSFGIYEYILQNEATENSQVAFIVQATIPSNQQYILAQYSLRPQLISIPYLLPIGSVIELISEDVIIDRYIIE